MLTAKQTNSFLFPATLFLERVEMFDISIEKETDIKIRYLFEMKDIIFKTIEMSQQLDRTTIGADFYFFGISDRICAEVI